MTIAVAEVSWTAERLGNLLLSPALCKGGVRDRVEKLRSEMYELFNNLLLDASNNSEEAKQGVRDLAYDIDEAVESYVRGELPAAAESKWKLGGAFDCVLKYYPTARSLRFRDDLDTFSRTIKYLMAATPGELSLSVVDPDPPPPQSSVGGDDVAELMQLLQGEQSKLSVIAVWGMGGTGKTTLARSVYNNRWVREHFDIRGWANVDRDFEARIVLETILYSLWPAHSKGEIARMETMELLEEIYKVQKGRRYLIVLDDVWSLKAWDTLRFAFPDDNNGSRIVITTRVLDLARRLATSVLHMNRLSLDQSWELLKLKSGLVDHPGMLNNPEIEMIGRKIVMYCKGLPLAIEFVSSTLRMKNLEQWEELLHVLQQGENLDFESTHKIFSSSYNNLRLKLKLCLLYLGHFPEDKAISVEKLCLLWMAEGMTTLMEVGEIYLTELVERGLVFAVEEDDGVSGPTRFKSCKLNDLVRDHCVSKGKQVQFFRGIDFGHGDKISSSSRRLVIYLDKFENTNDQLLLNIHEARHIRSILFYDRDGSSHSKPIWPRQVSDLTEFQGARVLDFDGVDFRVKKLPRGIHKLIYLRHLSFQGCYLHVFPSSFSNFPFMKTLDLRVKASCLLTITNVLWKISSLRFLFFPLKFRVDPEDKLKLDTLQELRVLENFNASLCHAKDLLLLQNLRILTGIVESDMDLNHIISYMNSNEFLRHSSLVVKKFDSYSQKRLSIVASLLGCNALHGLEIEGYQRVIPHHDRISSNSLTSLVFNGSEFTEDPMPILGRLPNLKSLVLCNDAFVGDKMVCSGAHNFLRLESLELATLQHLEEWEVGEFALPSLIVITIEQCNKLEALPIGLSNIPTLQRFKIGSMPIEFQEKVNQMVEKSKDMGHRKLDVSFYDC